MVGVYWAYVEKCVPGLTRWGDKVLFGVFAGFIWHQ